MSVQPVGIVEARRRARRWTQAQLGKRLNVHHSRVSLIESGKVQPTWREMKGLREHLGIEETDLLVGGFLGGLCPLCRREHPGDGDG
jgi:transcriptional regulator with XRE-family HTH domain